MSDARRCSITEALVLIGLLAAWAAQAQTALDRLDDALQWSSPQGTLRADLSALTDLEFYSADTPPQGLLFGHDEFLNYRAAVFVDAHWGDHLYGFTQTRIDRGFDPVLENQDVRLDEYLLRYTPLETPAVSVQAGKFATVVGNWVPRHNSWDNAFITPPLPYENVTAISDKTVPASPAAFLARRSMNDRRGDWLPVLWGPAYTRGAAVLGSLGRFDYAFDLKDNSVSSRPAVWDGGTPFWEQPTASARLGVRPGEAWKLGLSATRGAYLRPAAEETAAFPPGRNTSDFPQTTTAADAGFAHGHWEFWAEVFATRFDVPNVGPADTDAWYFESRYKFGPRLYAAARWNQQVFDDVPDGAGGEAPWDRDMWRADGSLGCRLTRHVQGKLQYSYGSESGAPQGDEHLVAAQLTAKF